MSKKQFFNSWAFVLLLCILARLPHFLSDTFYIDEDEAIIGIMAKDLLQGEVFPYYFYGQEYGFSFFEVVSTALFVLVLGSSIWAIKLGALLLFSLGITFIYAAFKQRNTDKWIVYLIIPLLVTFPTWYLWGAMPRGGYITAFTACSALFYLMQRQGTSIGKSILMGALLYIAYDAHALILLPFLPLVFSWWLIQQRKVSTGLVVGASAVVFIVGIKSLVAYINGRPPMNFSLVGMNSDNLISLLGSWDHGFTNFFYFSFDLAMPGYMRVVAFGMVMLMCISIVYGLIKGTWRARITIVLVFVALCLNLALMSLMDVHTPRYFVSFFTGVLFLILYIQLEVEYRPKRALVLFLTCLSGLSIVAGGNMSRHWYADGKYILEDMRALHDRAEKEKVKGIIALDNHFAWNYFYGEALPAANLCWLNRTNEYSLRVKNIFENDPKDVMMIGFYGVAYGIEKDGDKIVEVEPVGHTMFVKRDVSMNDILRGRENVPCYYDNYW